MKLRNFGRTALEVTPLGFGTAELGYLNVPQSDCDRILGGVLDAGLNVLDTAECYPGSEERVGRAVGHRRGEFTLISKCGHHAESDDPPEWTPQIIRHDAERSLKRLFTDYLDVLLLHSCSAEILREGAVVEALLKCKEDGLTHFIGYSGDGEAAEVAIAMKVFDCLETSVNICDQQVLEHVLPAARESGLGVMSKRSLANTCWRNLSEQNPFYAEYAAPYTKRLKAMNFTPESIGFEGSWEELALRFTLFQPGLHIALIGGKNLEHLRDNIRIAEAGPLPPAVEMKIREIWAAHADDTWVGQS